ncbi:ADCL4 protein, partial [Motacilla alba]|nr:ADCL4 protein [Motacilla alba]
MAFFYLLPVILLVIFVASFISAIIRTIQTEYANCSIPPGVSNPGKLRLIVAVFIVTSTLVSNSAATSARNVVRSAPHAGLPSPGAPHRLPLTSYPSHGSPFTLTGPRPLPAVLLFHGGGWICCSLDSHERICQYIAKESGSLVVSVGYRLAPEHKYPAAYEDCLNATQHFLQHLQHYGVDPARVTVCGDSAGGNLAAAVSQTLAGSSDLPRLRAQILIYPGLQALDFNLPSYQQNRGVPLLFRERAVYYSLQYVQGDTSNLEEVLEGSHIPPDMRMKYQKWVNADNIPEEFKVRGYEPHKPCEFKPEVFEKVKRIREPSLCPLFAEDTIIQQLPESFILTCEYDVLRDDGLLYKKRLEDNGVRVTWYHLEDGFHGIINLFDYCGLSFPSGK